MNVESAREKVKKAILQLLLRSPSTATQITKALGRISSRATVLKYKDELVDEELIEPRLSSQEEHFRPRYFITEKGKTFLARNAKELLIDSAKLLAMMDSEDAGGWRRVLEILRRQRFIVDVKTEAKRDEKA